MNSELAVNQSRQESNTKIVLETITKPSPKINFSTTVEISTDKIENRAADNASLYKKLIYFMIGAFLCILWTPITIYFVFQCASVRLKNGRR